jgi:ribosome-associated heat shock protein Hsp15
MEEVRADSYLWAIRMYKSRSLASTAIKGGKVKLNGDNFKPSHVVKTGEVYSLSIGNSKKIIEVVALLDKRGSFELASKHYKDLSPPPEKSDKLPSAFFKNNVQRERGSGRPSKKDRRDIDDLNYF